VHAESSLTVPTARFPSKDISPFTDTHTAILINFERISLSTMLHKFAKLEYRSVPSVPLQQQLSSIHY